MRLPVTPATTLLRTIRDEMARFYGGGRVVVAVDGLDNAGQSAFADELGAVLAEPGLAVFRASMDGFRRPRAERFARGLESGEGRYRDTFDEPTFRRVLLDPFREGWQTSSTTGFQLEAFDVQRDAPVEARWETAPDDATLIVDGIFLHRESLRAAWDWSVWLEGAPRPMDERVRASQRLYFAEVDPRAAATVVIDRTDPDRPRRVVGG